MSESSMLIPEVTDADVEWCRSALNLRDLDSARQEFLRARETLDVAACPGSGKTTLIIAKLAILARKWPYRTRGVCVLSHTNAAREEIQRRLKGTIVGQQLLSYPHFVDTIHGFVNRFLALPWLRSNGFPSPTIGDDVTMEYRRRAIGEGKYRAVQNYLERKNSGFDRLRIRDRDLRFGIGKPFPAGEKTTTYQSAKLAVESAARAGCFCHDEMFVWANALLADCPGAAAMLRLRFPLVIVDEMQDTSELQLKMLDSVFPRSEPGLVVQRVGDPNQAIYDAAVTGSERSGDFPDSATCLSISRSFRFGPEIARLASPFAVEPVGPDGLQGAGPRAVRDAPEQCGNAMFVFPDACTDGVLDAYGRHVLSTFSDAALEDGDVAAVGAVHQDASEVKPGHSHFPKTVSHYWNGYMAEISRREPYPRTFVQYVRSAQAVVRDGRDLAPGVEMIASGLVRLARQVGANEVLRRRIPRHRVVVEMLAGNPAVLAAYRDLVRAYLVDWEVLTEVSWNTRRVDVLAMVAGLCSAGAMPNARDGFLRWDNYDPSLTATNRASRDAGPNICRVVEGGREVNVRLGSVHSVKGRTHLATLLLSTYWHAHSSSNMLPWLLGRKVNLDGAGVRDRVRLLQTYVAMTRPSHMVCLAVPRSVLGDDSAFDENVAILKGRGWRVGEVLGGVAKWCE